MYRETPWWQKCLICCLASEDLAWTYVYLVALFPGFTCITFDTFVALKFNTCNNLFNTHQRDFNIKQDDLSLYLHARKPRMSRGSRWARVWTLHPIQSKKRKSNDSWSLLKHHNIEGKKEALPAQNCPAFQLRPAIQRMFNVMSSLHGGFKRLQIPTRNH